MMSENKLDIDDKIPELEIPSEEDEEIVEESPDVSSEVEDEEEVIDESDKTTEAEISSEEEDVFEESQESPESEVSSDEEEIIDEPEPTPEPEVSSNEEEIIDGPGQTSEQEVSSEEELSDQPNNTSDPEVSSEEEEELDDEPEPEMSSEEEELSDQQDKTSDPEVSSEEEELADEPEQTTEQEISSELSDQLDNTPEQEISSEEELIDEPGKTPKLEISSDEKEVLTDEPEKTPKSEESSDEEKESKDGLVEDSDETPELEISSDDKIEKLPSEEEAETDEDSIEEPINSINTCLKQINTNIKDIVSKIKFDYEISQMDFSNINVDLEEGLDEACGYGSSWDDKLLTELMASARRSKAINDFIVADLIAKMETILTEQDEMIDNMQLKVNKKIRDGQKQKPDDDGAGVSTRRSQAINMELNLPRNENTQVFDVDEQWKNFMIRGSAAAAMKFADSFINNHFLKRWNDGVAYGNGAEGSSTDASFISNFQLDNVGRDTDQVNATAGTAAVEEANAEATVIDEAIVGAAAIDEAIVGAAAIDEAIVGAAAIDEAIVGAAAIDEAIVGAATIEEGAASNDNDIFEKQLDEEFERTMLDMPFSKYCDTSLADEGAAAQALMPTESLNDQPWTENVEIEQLSVEHLPEHWDEYFTGANTNSAVNEIYVSNNTGCQNRWTNLISQENIQARTVEDDDLSDLEDFLIGKTEQTPEMEELRRNTCYAATLQKLIGTLGQSAQNDRNIEAKQDDNKDIPKQDEEANSTDEEECSDSSEEGASALKSGKPPKILEKFIAEAHNEKLEMEKKAYALPPKDTTERKDTDSSESSVDSDDTDELE